MNSNYIFISDFLQKGVNIPHCEFARLEKGGNASLVPLIPRQLVFCQSYSLKKLLRRFELKYWFRQGRGCLEYKYVWIFLIKVALLVDTLIRAFGGIINAMAVGRVTLDNASYSQRFGIRLDWNTVCNIIQRIIEKMGWKTWSIYYEWVCEECGILWKGRLLITERRSASHEPIIWWARPEDPRFWKIIGFAFAFATNSLWRFEYTLFM